ncbi:uncharacterized protein ACNS7B_002992 [Menidia menidia]
MDLSRRNGALLLAILAALCVELHVAQHVMGRCVCPATSKLVRGNMTDFQVHEKRPGCDKTELIVTVKTPANSTLEICLHTDRRFGQALLKCWGRINKDKSRKMECIEWRRKAEDRTSED